jgi:glutathione S-transferase
MGAGASAGISEKLDCASKEDLQKAVDEMSKEDREKLRKVIEAAAAPAPSGPVWKAEAVPDGGVLVCGHPGSGNVIPLMIFGMLHMKDKFKFQMCDIMKGEQMSPDFLAMNPFHQVPSAKMSDGTCLYEGCAALRYLALKFAPDLYPADKQLIIDMAMDKRQTDLYKAWAPIGYHAMGIGPAPPKDAAKKLNAVLAMMEKAFLSGKYVGGDKLCIADYAILPFLNTLVLPVTKKMGYKLPERWAKYLEDGKADLGDTFTKAEEAHEGWLSGNTEKMEAVAFDADEELPGASGEWKIESVPDGGYLCCGHPASGNVIPLAILGTKHMKDKYKFQMCDIMKGEQFGADYLAMNPFHQVPSGKMSDGTNLYESSASLRYLALKHAPELYPEDKRLIIDIALDKRQTDFYKAWGAIGYWVMQIGAAPGKDAAKKLNELLGLMEKAFLSGKYIGGDKLCIADYSYLPLLHTLTLAPTKKLGYTLPERWAKYLADAKAELGDTFTEAVKAHEGWVNSNEEKIEKIEFDA